MNALEKRIERAERERDMAHARHDERALYALNRKLERLYSQKHQARS